MIDVSEWTNEPGKPVRIWEGDCLDLMAAMPDGCVSWCYADPRYNARMDYGMGESDDTPWPEWASWLDERIREMERVSQGLVLVSVSVTGLLAFTEHVRRPTWVASWHKPWSSGVRVGGSPWLPHWEPVMQFGRAWGEGGRVPDYYLSDVLRANPAPAKRSFHPCPKPEGLIGQLVAAIPGDLILDPFLGSGTTAVVCDRLGRRWMGAEINPEYVQMATERIMRAREQLRLPLEVGT